MTTAVAIWGIRAIRAIGRSGAGFHQSVQLFSISRMADRSGLNGRTKPAPGKSGLRRMKEIREFGPLGAVVRVSGNANGIKLGLCHSDLPELPISPGAVVCHSNWGAGGCWTQSSARSICVVARRVCGTDGPTHRKLQSRQKQSGISPTAWGMHTAWSAPASAQRQDQAGEGANSMIALDISASDSTMTTYWTNVLLSSHREKIMANGKFVAYYRVSTARQGQSGLGLDAQRSAVENYLNGGKWQLVAEFVEVETGKGSNALAKRPQLGLALAECKRRKATLLIAVLDRLGRNVHFITGLMESGIDFVAVDSPNDSPFMLQVKAAVAEDEVRKISTRTKAALAAAKARGVVLGATGPANLKRNIEARQEAADAFAANVAPTINGLRGQGLSQRAIVEQLNATGVPTPRGGRWSLLQLQRTLARLPG